MAAVVVGVDGCSPEGTGTVKIDPGASARLESGAAASKKTPTAKQAKAKELIEGAAKKNPKLY
jgi:hypothetical protein